jgi:hypothetical protein
LHEAGDVRSCIDYSSSLGCGDGGASFLEDASAGGRPPATCSEPPEGKICEDDMNCAGHERCASIHCTSSVDCADPRVADGGSCGASMKCALIQTAGPRGEWVQMEITAGQPCGVVGCTSTWRVTPDGRVAFEATQEPARTTLLSEGDLDTINAMADGVELRPALRDGLDCGYPPAKPVVTLSLELSTETLTRDISACTSGESNVLQKIYLLLTRY